MSQYEPYILNTVGALSIAVVTRSSATTEDGCSSGGFGGRRRTRDLHMRHEPAMLPHGELDLKLLESRILVMKVATSSDAE